MVVELSDTERETLKGALLSYETELREEILRTDDREFKSVLRNDEAVIKEIMQRISLQ
jgi:hypothetical protein